MSTYEFTYDEERAIEKAAADHLSAFLTDRDAEEVAYDFAQAIRGALAEAAVREASVRLSRLAYNEGTDPGLFEGLEYASDRVRDFAAECAAGESR
jgi:hypothetical protein